MWSVGLYGCESWTLRKANECQLAAAEIWLWREVLRTKWFEKGTNSYVRNQVKVPESNGLLEEVKRRKRRKSRHRKRKTRESADGDDRRKVPGKGRRGGRRMNRMDNIMAWIESGLKGIHTSARNRDMPTVRAPTMHGRWLN